MWLKYGYIIESNFNENEMIKDILMKKKNEKVLNFIVCPTGQCSMRCRYCSEDFYEEAMTNEVRDSLILFIKNNITKYKEINMNWFGGKQLLEKEIIYSLLDEIIKIVDENNMKYSAFMVTNGTLLDLNTFI